MFVDTAEFTKFMVRHNVRADQVLFIYLIYTKRYSDITMLFNSPLRGFSSEVIQDLVERGLIQDLNKEGEMFADLYMVSDSVANDLFVHTDFPAEEFWDTYPPFMHIQGKRVPIRGVPKETFLKTYMKKIQRNPNVHRKVMKALKTAIGQGEVNMRIDNWILSEMWKTVDPVSEEQQSYGTEEI